MREMKRLMLRLLCGPWDLATALLLLALLPITRGRLRSEHGVLWLDVGEDSFVQRRWRYSTTFGHAVLLQPGLRGSSVERHELVHVRQFEGAVCSLWLVAMTFSVAFAALGHLGALLAVAILGPWWSYFGASLSAFLRDERAYLDNEYERAARALAENTAPESRA